MQEIVRACHRAAECGVKLLVLPELCVTGSTCGDLFLHRRLQEASDAAILGIAAETAELDMVIVLGAPVKAEGKLYNCAVVISRGEILHIFPKTHLTSAESRQFAAASDKSDGMVMMRAKIGDWWGDFSRNVVLECDVLPELRISCEIGTDLWAMVPPSIQHAKAGATVIACPSAICETVGAADYRRKLAENASARGCLGYILAEAGWGESTTDKVFGGHQLICENGAILAETKPFANAANDCPMCITELDVGKLADVRLRAENFVTDGGYGVGGFSLMPEETVLTREIETMPFVPEDPEKRAARCAEILTIQAMGLRKRIAHTHAKCAVIGISGGLDSCLALLVAVRAMDLLSRPRTDVIAVTMPCFGTTKRTRSNAELLCEKLGVTFRCIDIKAAVNQHFADIGHDESVRNVVYENVQARERTQVIMDIANAEGGMVIGTGDLSELALGWATYNGDHMSMYGVNAGVPKTLIRHIVRYFADTCGDDELAAVLMDIFNTPVSPELLPADDKGEIAQKTEDLVGPYELHDFFLYYTLRFGFTPDKIERMANYAFADDYDAETVHKWLATFMRRFVTQQFKRSCLPDGPKVGSVGVSPRGDLAMPSDASGTVFGL